MANAANNSLELFQAVFFADADAGSVEPAGHERASFILGLYGPLRKVPIGIAAGSVVGVAI